MNYRKAYVATIQIVVLADSEGEASDAISEMIRPSENRLNPEGSTLDWRYSSSEEDKRWTIIETVPEREKYEEGDVFIRPDTKLFAIVTEQGTPLDNTVMSEADYNNPALRENAEYYAKRDPEVKEIVWKDVTENEAFWKYPNQLPTRA